MDILHGGVGGIPALQIGRGLPATIEHSVMVTFMLDTCKFFFSVAISSTFYSESLGVKSTTEK